MTANTDREEAAGRLAGRTGCDSFSLEWTCEHAADARLLSANKDRGVPCTCPAMRWRATATWGSNRIHSGDFPTSGGAAEALALRLLDGAICRCLKPVATSNLDGHCHWQRNGPVWTSSCSAPPIKSDGERGDVAGMITAFNRRRAENQ